METRIDDLSVFQFASHEQETLDFGNNMAGMRFPNDRERMAIVGATGSGKTHAALWHLSLRDYNIKPWVIYDYKYDELINSIEGIQEISPYAEPPEKPGLYVVHPEPDTDDDAIESQMRAIWRQENTGVYVDEGYMIGNRNKAFRALLTQGRSKHIPMIILSQRPVWMDKFVFTESEFFQVFRLQNSQDINRMEEFIPFDISKRLPEFHSYYYDVKGNRLNVLRSVPDAAAILQTFNSRLSQMVKAV